MAYPIHSRRISGFGGLRPAALAAAAIAVLATLASPAEAQPQEVAALAATAPMTARPHTADGPANCGPETMRDTVRDLVRALSANRADDAFATTAPSVQEKFRNSRLFLTVIARFQTPLYGARHIQFDGVDHTGDHPVVRAYVDLGKKRRWLARFAMEPQADGVWKILDVKLTSAPGHVI